MKRVTGCEYKTGSDIPTLLMVDGVDPDNLNRSYPFERVVHAHWECSDDIYGNGVCSACKRDCGEIYSYVDYDRCPYCGAHMDEKRG